MSKILTESCTSIFRSVGRRTIHTDEFAERWRYSRLPVTRTLYKSNLPLTRSNFHFPSNHFPYNFTLDNSNFFLFSLKARINGIRLYIQIEVKSSFPFQLSRHAIQTHAEMGATAPLPTMVHTPAHVY